MSEYTNSRQLDASTDLNLIRDQCGTLELALQNETDPARMSDLRRELAECRQLAFEVEQRDQPEAAREAGGPAGDPLPPVAVRGDSEQHAAPFVTIEAADPRPDYAGLYAAERNETAELRQELAEEGQGAPSSGGMERERVDPEISRLAEVAEAHRTGVQMFGGIYGGGPDVPQAGEHSPTLVELAEQHEARLLARDEVFSGEVVAQIERENESPAYVIEADGDRVMVPEVEGADMEVGDDVEISRDQQGDYEAEAGHDYGR